MPCASEPRHEWLLSYQLRCCCSSAVAVFVLHGRVHPGISFHLPACIYQHSSISIQHLWVICCRRHSAVIAKDECMHTDHLPTTLAA